MHLPRIVVFFVSTLIYASVAIRFDLRGASTSQLHKRAHIAGLEDAQNLNYLTNITLGGKLCSVTIDTGRQVYPLFTIPLNLNVSLAPICGSRVMSPTRRILAFLLAFNMLSMASLEM